jgi:hypothetical protein
VAVTLLLHVPVNPVKPLGEDICRPDGRLSVKVIANEPKASVLVSVNVKLVLPCNGM